MQTSRREFLRWAALTPCVMAPAGAQSGLRAVQVDAAEATGTIRDFQHVNVGPAHSRAGVADVVEQYRDLRVSSVRTHDFYGPTDIDAYRPGEPWDQIIFPHWEADPEREDSYNFGPSDRLIKAIVECGAGVYFRIGRSWNAVAAPPADFEKFAHICRHVVMHYNGGWAGGHRYGIRYWEFWNEPDGRFWSGSPGQFWELYEKTARALKSHDPELMVGACGLAGSTRPGPYREGLIRYCAERNVPLDFYSWHHYARRTYDPYELAGIAREIRRLLDASGFEKAENHLTEWNIDPGVTLTPELRGLQDSMLNGAFTASALIYLQDAPVQMAHYYRGDAAHPMGLFFNNGRYKKKAYAYKALGMMLATPERVAAWGGDSIGFAVLAGRAPDGGSVQVLISNYEIRPPSPGPEPPRYEDNSGYALTVRNLPWGDAPYKVERRRVTETDDFTLTEQGERSGPLELVEELPAPGFELIVLRPSG